MKPEEIEKAIRGLKNIVEFWCNRPEEIETAKLAIAALEKQVPKIVNGGDEKTCSVCDGDILSYYADYCENCGQKLDWGDKK